MPTSRQGTTEKVTVSISKESWEWWQKNKWLKLSPLLERAIRQARKDTDK